MFRKQKLLAIVFLVIIVFFKQCKVQDNDNSRMKLFDLNWKFSYESNILASGVDFNDQNWRSLDLPHDWNKDADLVKSLKSQTDSTSSEIGWYRKHFEIPQDWMDKSIQIKFDGICNHPKIFVNGTPVSGSNNNNTSFQAILNPYLVPHGNNVIAVCVAVPKPTGATLPVESGIYKHVWLVIMETPDFKD